ncbi:metallophosphoesterase family protein [Terriglobus saanensis]|uniref:Phosphoesterase n=1 Tax=Terriglobus saanensis (strain ATCC BAA-1853 / DSM 23119 / SP1PR4) TaxID=401053 RepID=E8V0C7_TERSS|nr:metallophosphoesterase family protein [Terriglobus saanensis]ADV83345.1 phosphodiesterase, MJ0936 family [Terriglobus saanensis SP1PR4]
MKIGVISDTHGLLRPEAIETLQGCDAILHAGDVGNFDILGTLGEIASVTAIRGNIDLHGACADLPATEMVSLGGITFYMLHSARDLDLDPVAAGVRVVVSGHSHSPSIQDKQGVLFLNPGSAGPRRFGLPVTLAIVEINADKVRAEIVRLIE